MVVLGIHKVTHLSPKAHRQFCRMAGLDDLLARVLPKKPSWQQVTGKLGLSMPGRHVDNESLKGAVSHPFKGIGHAGMVPTPDE